MVLLELRLIFVLYNDQTQFSLYNLIILYMSLHKDNSHVIILLAYYSWSIKPPLLDIVVLLQLALVHLRFLRINGRTLKVDHHTRVK